MDISSAVGAKIRFITATAEMYIQSPILGASWGHAYSVGQLRDEARSYLMPYVEQARDMGVKAEGIAVSGIPPVRLSASPMMSRSPLWS